MYENILYQVLEGVATITLNRPQVYNALSKGLLDDITNAVKTAASDVAVRVVVITAAGDKAFCSGADLKASMDSSATLGGGLRAHYNPMIMAIRQIPKPVVGRINGLAVGAGCSLALACDVVIASEGSYFSQIFVNMPDAGSTFFLPRLIGMQRAFEMASTGRRVYAPEAQQMGLIKQAVAPDQLDAAVAEVVDYYKNAPTQAIGRMKQVLNQSLYSDLEQMLELEAMNQDELGKTNDVGEGIMAFLQKRKANFKGK
jgi:2-(1,2-epoxy-1,2-dihydrophenyl)acetyl-CoA isomerase